MTYRNSFWKRFNIKDLNLSIKRICLCTNVQIVEDYLRFVANVYLYAHRTIAEHNLILETVNCLQYFGKRAKTYLNGIPGSTPPPIIIMKARIRSLKK